LPTVVVREPAAPAACTIGHAYVRVCEAVEEAAANGRGASVLKIRTYQDVAAGRVIHRGFDAEDDRGTVKKLLIVLATGLGKTVIFCEIIRRLLARSPTGRMMILTHREELTNQAARKVRQIAGQSPDIEMGELKAGEGFAKNRVVVSSVQTHNASWGDRYRMEKFDPDEFEFVVIDECHRAAAPTYARVIAHYTRNPNCLVLGVTATPIRADKKSLRNVFDQCVFRLDLADGIDQGWLVPPMQYYIPVEGLDLSSIRSAGDDLNAKDLKAFFRDEAPTHGMVKPTIEEAGDDKTLVFCASVEHARKVVDCFNERPESRDRGAMLVTGKTQNRGAIFEAFSRGEFQFLVNCDVAIEGVDVPDIGCVAVMRPTSSLSRYIQMIGRGTRTLDGLLNSAPDGEEHAAARKAIIAASGKPSVKILDFRGNSGRHKLCDCLDVFAGNIDEEVIDRARAELMTGPAWGNVARVDVRTAIEPADLERHREAIAQERAKAEARRLKERERFRGLAPDVKYSKMAVDLLGGERFDIESLPPRVRQRPASPRQVKMLERRGVENADSLSMEEANRMVEELYGASQKQVRILKRAGFEDDELRGLLQWQASKLIDMCKANGWRRPDGQEALR
jgi:superfamily II DNA or RNA helicase